MKDRHFLERTPITELYDWFADETAATSPTWERLCRWITATPEIHERLDTLPRLARQPNRFLAALRYLDGPTAPGPGLLAWLDEHWPEVEHLATTRTTQTNEPGRCRVTGPLLASLPQPVALLELGASAGLCLLPDRYDLPGTAGLTVAGRLGVDLNPLDPTDPDTRRWLRALVWPDEPDREANLARALEIAAVDPPEVRQADVASSPHTLIPSLVDELREAHPGATPVVMHSAVLAYLDAADRTAVTGAIRASGARWISMEGMKVVPDIAPHVISALGDPPSDTPFVLALDGRPRAWVQAHGRWARWVDQAGCQ